MIAPPASLTMHQIIKRVKYYFSSDKRVLDDYMARIRNLEQLSDSDWVRFRTLARQEKELTTEHIYPPNI